MATYKSSRAKAGQQARFLHTGAIVEYAEYTASATLAAADIIEMVKVPEGARVHDIKFTCNGIATGSTGSAAILTVGDGVDANRYMDQISASAAGVYQDAMNTTADIVLGYRYTAADTVDITVEDLSVSATHTAAAVFKMSVTYSVDGQGA